jgi:hypothetical protein
MNNIEDMTFEATLVDRLSGPAKIAAIVVAVQLALTIFTGSLFLLGLLALCYTGFWWLIKRPEQWEVKSITVVNPGSGPVT